MKNELDYEAESNGRGAFRVLMIAVTFMLGLIGACAITGCSTARDWIEEQIEEQIDEVKPDDEQGDEQSAEVDAVPFAELAWQYGGFKPASSTVIKGNISAVSFNGKTINYSASVDGDFGKEGHIPNATICAVFFKGSDGIWRGGKFDWIGNLGRPRPAHHIASYSGWKHAYPAPKGEEYLFVLIRGDNRKIRTNVIKGEVER